jgi:hypothetical protein
MKGNGLLTYSIRRSTLLLSLNLNTSIRSIIATCISYARCIRISCCPLE